MRYAHSPDSATCASDTKGGEHRLAVPDALEHRMRTKPAGELAHLFDCGFATLTNYIGCAKLASQRNAVRMAT